MTQTKDWAARLDAVRDELTTLAAEVRRLNAATVSIDAPREAIADAARAVARIADALEQHVPTPHPPRYVGGGTADDVTNLFSFDPVIGRLSPLAPPVQIEWQDPLAIGRVRFGVPYEGPPGCVHGGIIAATFDQVFNVANIMRGIAGPTRKLEIVYRKPTPLLTELRFEAWVDRVEGREVHTHGRILNGNVVTVEAQGTFVQLSHERVMRLLDAAKTTPAPVSSEASSAAVPAEPDRIAGKETKAARRRRFRSGGDGS
jgi:acyl-coenzyme A thioesterase PaaI-like protein